MDAQRERELEAFGLYARAVAAKEQGLISQAESYALKALELLSRPGDGLSRDGLWLRRSLLPLAGKK